MCNVKKGLSYDDSAAKSAWGVIMLTSTVIIGSQTNAMRAQRCLDSAKIHCNIIKSNTEKSRGCIYALRIPAEKLRFAFQALDSCNIKYEY